MNPDRYGECSAEVARAIETGRPIVALESTIISHGMPYPRNLETASAVEQVVRDAGAVPATIAIIGGKFRVGLTAAQLELLAASKEVAKASRRDLGIILARGTIAATTVATTMIGAARAGIRVFATGGTGGVHRGVAESFDVSADLQELARTPVAVISAGVKSILDIPKTLEYLETMGVPVYGWCTDDFPAFYTRSSGLPVPLRVDGAAELASALVAQWDAGLDAGALVANPIPVDDELAHGYIEGVIEQAVTEADRQGIHGRNLTPFLLGRIVELTGGRSLEANIALVKNNARVAAEVAVALTKVDGGLEAPVDREEKA
ncbi:MAG: pseudouridine-5'-phosphate glycosidase [Spirochaetota bacterium]